MLLWPSGQATDSKPVIRGFEPCKKHTQFLNSVGQECHFYTVEVVSSNLTGTTKQAVSSVGQSAKLIISRSQVQFLYCLQNRGCRVNGLSMPDFQSGGESSSLSTRTKIRIWCNGNMILSKRIVGGSNPSVRAINNGAQVKWLRYLPVTEYGAGSTPVSTAVIFM